MATGRKNKPTRNPCGDGFTSIELLIKGIHHVEKRFACVLRATCCIQGFTKTLSNRDTEIIKLPIGYLSKAMTIAG